MLAKFEILIVLVVGMVVMAAEISIAKLNFALVFPVDRKRWFNRETVAVGR